jgi:hypothetical protein
MTINAKATTAVRQAQTHAAREELNHPSRTPLHKLFILISFLTAATSLCMAVGQLLGIVYQSDGPIEYVLNGYIILFCCLIIFNELQWTLFTRDSKILKYWVTRGLLYAFVGVIGLEQNDQAFDAQSQNTSQRAFEVSLAYIKAVAYILISCGALYFIMGLFCLQLLYNRILDAYGERVEMAKRLKTHGVIVGSPLDEETG